MDKFTKLKKRLPKKYWLAKIEKNIKSGRNNRTKLRKDDWKVLRIWEHEILKNLDITVEKITKFLKQ